MVLNNKCHIARIQTLADGTIRLVVDLLDGDSNDIATAFRLRSEETFISIVAKSALSTGGVEEDNVKT